MKVDATPAIVARGGDAGAHPQGMKNAHRAQAWPAGEGEMSARIRAHNWRATRLGPVEGWPPSLKTAVQIALDSAFPCYVWWGAELIQFYNDPAVAINRGKHPAMFARSAREGWVEAWDKIGPIVERILAGEQAVLGQDLPLLPDRGGPVETAWFTFSYSPLRAETGSVAGVFITAIETTSRVKAEIAMRESEERLTAIVAQASVGLSKIAADGRILMVNDEVCRLLGRRAEEIVGLSVADVTSSEDHPECAQALARVWSTGHPEALEKRYVRPDGTYVRASSRLNRLEEGGEPSAILAATIDLTERDRTEAALRTSEERQAFLLKLSDALRPLANPVAIQVEATRVLGEHLKASRALYAEVEPEADSDYYVVRQDYHRPGVPSLTGRFRADDFGARLFDDMRAGYPVVVDDVAVEPRLTKKEREAYPATGVRAHIAMPLIKSGRHVAILAVHQSEPRVWTSEDVRLVAETAERTWAAVERARAEAALRESEERFQQFGDASSGVLWIRNAQSLQVEYLSAAFESNYGTSRDGILSCSGLDGWLQYVLPDDRDHALHQMGRVCDGQQVTFEFRIRRPSDDEIRWMRNINFPLLDEHGRVQRIGGISQDVTIEKAASDRLQVLVAELQHRTRNLIAVVRSLSTRTLRESGSLQEFDDRFKERLRAVARVQGLLSRLADGERITFDQLLRAELSAYGPMEDAAGRVILEGPSDIRLRSSAVQTLALAVHELTTNAIKYGALAAPEGRLSIRWHLQPGPDGTPERLHVEWEERGVEIPPSSERPQGSGYGRELIERALPYQLGAETRYELCADGVRCVIMVPISREPASQGPSEA